MTYDPPVTHFRDPHDTPATLMTPLRFSWHPCDKRAADTYDTYDTHTNDICSVAILFHVINEKCVHTSSLLSDMNARSDEWLRLHRVDGRARSVFLALSDEAQEAIRRKGGLGFNNTSMVLMNRIRAHHGWVHKKLKRPQPPASGKIRQWQPQPPPQAVPAASTAAAITSATAAEP